MTHKLEIYKCKICSNVIEVTHEGVGDLVCCNQNMTLMPEIEPSEENAHFAHIEKLSDIEKRIFFNHPMTPEHHLEYIEVISSDKKYLKRKFLKQDDNPELTFKCDCKEGFYVRLYCNIDGVYVTK
ncbi:desulfoferrodoxin FeS4 iron-binding domain-containing protein [bacterium]|nr:desulfoferrodoxin FeS4 iron-binding domain-containing protein [bacterium]